MIAWVGPAADAPAADRRVDLGGRARGARVRRLAQPTWSSPATAARSSPPGWPASRYDGGGIATSVAATRAATDDELRRLVAARVAEMRAPGHHHRGDQERLRADRRRRGCGRCGVAAEFTAETTFLGAHVVPAEYAHDRAGYLDLVTGPMLAAVRPVRALDRRVLRAGSRARLRRRRGPGGADRRSRRRARAAGARQPARPRARACGWRSSWARPASTTAPT